MEVNYPKRTPLQVDASIASSLDIGKVCLCPTNSVFADKDPCPKGELNYSKVVITKRKDNE
ncbi:hypothetical protein DXC89_07290 [Prevotella disiens]|uniref:Uncharacterized protein n=1 Tax=Prevotella disiens TaxID=28130 RepID=A0A3E4QJX9_9BACT|nr:hypothetical protein DXC89_07290 [Prevotella disiens]